MKHRIYQRISILSHYFQTGSVLAGVLFTILAALPLGSQAQEKEQSNQTQTKKQTQKDWPGFLGSHRDGKSAPVKLQKSWEKGALKQDWQISITESYAAPTVVGNRVYFFERVGGENILRCLNLKDGKSVWQYKYKTEYRDMYGYNNGPRCSPMVDDGFVYIYGPEGEIHAIEADTGRLKWKVDTSSKFGVIQNFFGVGSTPVIHKNLIIAMVGGSPAKSRDVPRGQLNQVVPNGSGIVAFDKKSGEVKYKVGNFLASYSSPIVANINGKPTGIALMREGLFGFQPEDGKKLFEFPWRARMLESVNASTPVVIKDQILISECYGVGGALLQWKDSKLKTIWSDRSRRPMNLTTHWNTPIVVDGHIYASCGRNSGTAELRCIELQSGKIKWRQKGFQRSTLTYADQHFILLGEYGKLLLFKPNPQKFEMVTTFESETLRLKYPCWAAPVVSQGKMFILTANKLICFSVAEK